jgi:polar amino acid transport system permease protein
VLSIGRGSAGRSSLIAAASTVVVGGGLAAAVVLSPGWDRFKQTFFDGKVFRETFPELPGALWINIKIFLLAEAIVLVAGLILAICRSLPGPVFFPIRLLGAIYSDIFRSIPPLLLILMLGFGAPALGISGVPTSTFFWGVIALALVYTSFVSEVYRAGIDSVHPGQNAAARSLGLSRTQSLRYVVIPQAVRRIIPPLLNDFIGLQKDTALVSTLGIVEVLRTAQIKASGNFNYTPYVAAAVIFLLLTIPMTRLTDWLIGRDRRRRQTSGALG